MLQSFLGSATRNSHSGIDPEWMNQRPHLRRKEDRKDSDRTKFECMRGNLICWYGVKAVGSIRHSDEVDALFNNVRTWERKAILAGFACFLEKDPDQLQRVIGISVATWRRCVTNLLNILMNKDARIGPFEFGEEFRVELEKSQYIFPSWDMQSDGVSWSWRHRVKGLRLNRFWCNGLAHVFGWVLQVTTVSSDGN